MRIGLPYSVENMHWTSQWKPVEDKFMNFEQGLLLPMLLNPMIERNSINPESMVEKNLR
jgi:hypothetical protein